MSLLNECPDCFGLIAMPGSTLSSACRCGYPDTVTWDDFPALRNGDLGLTEVLSNPIGFDEERDAA